MNIGFISMIRNEIDIIKPFLLHCASLFDSAFLIDHRSMDGTSEILKEATQKQNGWHYYLLDTTAKIQNKVTNFFIKYAFEEKVDFLFILDSDEFINVPDRIILEKKLKDLEKTEMVGSLQWINCAPCEINASEFNPNSKILLSPQSSAFHKVIIPGTFYEKHQNMYTSLGNHSVVIDGKKIDHQKLGTLFHIPTRSKNQAIKKAIVTSISSKANLNIRAGMGYQTNEFLKHLIEKDIDSQTLLQLTYIYQSSKAVTDNQEKINKFWEGASCTSLEQVPVAFSKDLKFLSSTNGEGIYKIIADALLNYEIIDPDDYDIALHDHVITIQKHRSNIPRNNEPKSIDTHFKQLNTPNTQLSNLNQQATSLQNELNKIKLMNESLKNEVFILRGKVHFYEKSKSWRYTKPLRKLMAFVRKLK